MLLNQQSIPIVHLHLACHMPRPSHPPSFRHSNNIWRGAQTVATLIMQISAASSLFAPFRSKHCSQTPSVCVLPLTWDITLTARYCCYFRLLNKQAAWWPTYFQNRLLVTATNLEAVTLDQHIRM
jgi:hypothetical protein